MPSASSSLVPHTLRLILSARIINSSNVLLTLLLEQSLPAASDLRTALFEDMSRPPCSILTHFPQAPKRTPLLLLNSNLGDTLQYLAAYGYYPSFEIRHMLQRINATKTPLLDALERSYGARTHSTSTTRNRCFFLLEHLEALWMKHFVSSLLTLCVPTSLIWLHDGIWVAPAPPRSLIDTANRRATTAIQVSPLPLQLSCTPLFPKYKEAYQNTIHGSPPPSHDPPPIFVPPLRLLHPPLSELEARQAFIRMMARQQQPLRDTIRTQPPPPPVQPDEVIVID